MDNQNEKNEILIKPLTLLNKKLAKLSENERIVLQKRLLGEIPATLEKIGRELGVTRERVRQIEKSALRKLSKIEDPSTSKVNKLIEELLEALGGIATVEGLIKGLKEKVGDLDISDIQALKVFIKAHPELKDLRQNINFKAGVLSSGFDLKKGEEILERIKKEIQEKGLPQKIDKLFGDMDECVVRGVIKASHALGLNFKNEVGLSSWASIKPKKIRDKVYYILQKEGTPLHFRKIAQLIEGSELGRGKKVFERTVHNELINDDRFVLIGRGIYALKEWGYKQGTVADVIENILKEVSRPMTTVEITEAVGKQRDVKKSTIFVNLQNKNRFMKTDKATYALKK